MNPLNGTDKRDLALACGAGVLAVVGIALITWAVVK